MQSRRWLWSAHPIRGLAEMWLLGALILFGLVRLSGAVVPIVFSSGTLFLCGACGMWAVLRIRLLPASRWRHLLWETGTALACSAVMIAGIYAPAQALGGQMIWEQIDWSPTVILVLCALTGLGYLIARGAIFLGYAWDALRRRQLLWSLTHAHLTVVVLVAGVAVIGSLVIAPFTGAATLANQTTDPVASWITRLLLILFPATSIIVVLTLAAIVFLLPPSALFSFVVARQTTRRLEKLTAAAAGLRAGDYGARVAVDGEDEVAQLQSDFNAMAANLQATLVALQHERDTVTHLLQARRELTASVSHELRTPVATVRALLDTSLERMAEGPVSQLRQDLETAQGEITRLQTLIDDLFALSRVQAEGLALDCRPTDIRPAVEHTTAAIAAWAWQTGRVHVVADLPQELPSVCVDPERLNQVLVNLLRNGVRHTPPGGIVATHVEVAADHLLIHVRDTGEGISAEDLPLIWERFYRGGAARDRDDAGAGIGLALVQELTQAMGGTVAVESQVGQGSCFTVKLPRA